MEAFFLPPSLLFCILLLLFRLLRLSLTSQAWEKFILLLLLPLPPSPRILQRDKEEETRMRAMDGGKANRGNEEREGHSRSGSHAPFPGTVATLFKKKCIPSIPSPLPLILHRACVRVKRGRRVCPLSTFFAMPLPLYILGKKRRGDET